jgi:hypothetical protein
MTRITRSSLQLLQRLSQSRRIVAIRDISHLGWYDFALSAAMIRLSLYHHCLVVHQAARRAGAYCMARICKLRIRASGALRACVIESKAALPWVGSRNKVLAVLTVGE